MLVLSRRPGEEIIINGNIRVTIVSLKGDRVRIGVEAPPEIAVDRAEVHARRMEFQPVEVMAGHHDDDTVALGGLSGKSSLDDTAKH